MTGSTPTSKELIVKYPSALAVIALFLLFLVTPTRSYAQCVDWFLGGAAPVVLAGSGRIDALAVYDSGNGPELYAVGSFPVGLGNDYGLFRWNGSTWGTILGRFSAAPTALAVYNGELYACGNFNLVAGLTVNRIVRYNGATFQTVGDGVADAMPTAMVAYAGELYVAGPQVAGGLPVNSIARWNGLRWAPVGTPSAGVRNYHSMAYDPVRQRTVLVHYGSVATEVYEWDGVEWLKIHTGGPPRRDSASLVFDSLHGVMVYFGGKTIAGPLNDTWTWDGSTWTQINTPGPAPRFKAAMAFDSVRGKTVLNGGRDNDINAAGFQDTWEFDGATWTQVSASGPEGRNDHAMVFDDAIGKTVLFGGNRSGLPGSIVAYTWTWDGTTWVHSPNTIGPGQRLTARMAYDSIRQKVVLFSGDNAVTPDLWEWNGSAWALISIPTDPAGRQNHTMAFDAARGLTVIYGGSSGPTQTWTWNGSSWGAFPQGIGGIVNSMVTFDDGGGEALFLGGQFTTAGLIPAAKIARYRNGQWSSLGGGATGGGVALIYALAVSGGKLYAGGNFTSMSGTPCLNLAAWNGAWSSVDLGQTSPVRGLGNLDSNPPLLLASGIFTFPNRPSGTYFTAWNGTNRMDVVGFQTVQPERFASFPYNGRPAAWMSASSGNGVWVLGETCRLPTVTTQPTPTFGSTTQSANFSIVAQGSATLTYRWRFNGVPLADVANRFTGTATPNLRIFNWSLNDVGNYDCVVTNFMGSTPSNPAAFSILGAVKPANPIAVSGQSVPDRPGITYTNFNPPIESPDGTIAFRSMQGTAWTMSRWSSGVTTTLLWPGSPLQDSVPGTLAEYIHNFSFGSQNELFAQLDAGRLPSNSVRGVWRAPVSGPITKVAAAGDEVPGTDGSLISPTGTQFPIGGDSGQMVFNTVIQSPGLPDRNALIYRDSDGLLSPFTVVGSAAPDRPGLIASIPNPTSLANKPDHSGRQLVYATLDTSVTIDGINAPVSGYWYGTPGSLKPVAVRGDLVPGRPDTVVVSASIAFQSDSGLISFVRQVFTPPSTTAYELCLLNHGVEQVLLTSADVLAPGETINSLLIIAMNNNGEAVTQVASKVNGVCCKYSYWLISPSAPPALIARAASQPLPNCPGFDLLGNLGASSINDDGMVILKCALKGVGGTGDGVLGWTRVHGLFPIVLPGDQIEISPNVYKTVWLCQLSSVVAGAPITTYNCRSINAAGQVPLSMQFQTFTPSYAIAVADFPSLLASRFPCAAVTAESPDLIVPQGDTIALDAGVSGANPTTFRWTKDGQDVTNDARTSGATTRHLRITSATQSDAATYQLHATDSCGTVQSRPISVTIPCPADFDSDGTVDFFDYDAFITCFEGGPCPPGKSADFDADGAADFFDYDAFVTAFETPC